MEASVVFSAEVVVFSVLSDFETEVVVALEEAGVVALEVDFVDVEWTTVLEAVEQSKPTE